MAEREIEPGEAESYRGVGDGDGSGEPTNTALLPPRAVWWAVGMHATERLRMWGYSFGPTVRDTRGMYRGM